MAPARRKDKIYRPPAEVRTAWSNLRPLPILDSNGPFETTRISERPVRSFAPAVSESRTSRSKQKKPQSPGSNLRGLDGQDDFCLRNRFQVIQRGGSILSFINKNEVIITSERLGHPQDAAATNAGQ